MSPSTQFCKPSATGADVSEWLEEELDELDVGAAKAAYAEAMKRAVGDYLTRITDGGHPAPLKELQYVQERLRRAMGDLEDTLPGMGDPIAAAGESN